MSKNRALHEFDKFASCYDNDSDEWQDMSLDEVFMAGYNAGLKSRPIMPKEALVPLKTINVKVVDQLLMREYVNLRTAHYGISFKQLAELIELKAIDVYSLQNGNTDYTFEVAQKVVYALIMLSMDNDETDTCE